MKSKKCIKSGMMSAILSAAMMMTGMPVTAAAAEFSSDESQAMETEVFSAEDELQEAANQEEEFSAGVPDEEELTEGIELENEEGVLFAEEGETSGAVVELNEENFPDKNFRNVLIRSFDPDGDGKVNVSDVVELDVSENEIKTLKGIELFTDLETLDCSHNFSDYDEDFYGDSTPILLEMDLSKNTKLRELNCDYTKLIELDLSNNYNLEELSCSAAAYNLDLKNLTNLKFLKCVSLRAESLDVSANLKLEELDCRWSSITSLDLSNNENLKKLDCHASQLSSLDVSNNKKLEELSCSRTPIESLVLGENENLKEIDCFETELESLDVSKCVNLTKLSCGGCNLSSLNLSGNINLSFLYCEDNNINELDMSNNSGLKGVFCENNHLTNIDVSKNTELKSLYCANNDLSSLDVSNNPALKYLNCNQNKLTTLDVSSNPELVSLLCLENQLSSLDLSKNKKLEEAKCDGNQISDLKGGENAGVTYVNKVQNIKISADSTFDLSKLPGKLNVRNTDTWEGGSVNGNILTVDKDAEQVTFNYYVYYGEEGLDDPIYIEGFKLLVTRPAVSAPAKVTNLKASSDTSSVKLTWKKASGATGYKVQRYNASNKKYETIATVKGTSYTDKKRSAAAAYAYRVYAYASKDGETANGAVSSSVKILTAPTAPGSVKISRSGAKTDKAKAILSFAPSKRASYYDIYKYNTKTKKYENAFRVKGKTLYSYNAKTKKYTKVNSVKTTSKAVTCTLTNLKLKSDGTQKYAVRAVVQKSGYAAKTSSQSKAVTLK